MVLAPSIVSMDRGDDLQVGAGRDDLQVGAGKEKNVYCV